jgi:hypothetical protein
MTPAHRIADAAVAREAAAGACGVAPSRVEPAGGGRWRAVLPDGGRATVEILAGAGFADAVARARVVDAPPGCARA